MDKSTPITQFDLNTIGTSTQIMKSLIPYLDPPMQKMMAILIRIRELMLTIQYFSTVKVKKITPHSNEELICQIKSFCSPEMVSSIDSMMSVLSMSEMMSMLSGMDINQSGNPGMSDIMNLFNMMQHTPAAEETKDTKKNDGNTKASPNAANNANITTSAGTKNAASTHTDNNSTTSTDTKTTVNTTTNTYPNITTGNMRKLYEKAATNNSSSLSPTAFLSAHQKELLNEYLKELDNIL